MAAYEDVHHDLKADNMTWRSYMLQRFERTPGSYYNKRHKMIKHFDIWAQFFQRKKATKKRAKVAAMKIANGQLSRALHT